MAGRSAAADGFDAERKGRRDYFQHGHRPQYGRQDRRLGTGVDTTDPGYLGILRAVRVQIRSASCRFLGYARMPQRVSESHPLKLPIDSIELDYSRSRILHACEPQIELDFGNSPANIWPQPLPPLTANALLDLQRGRTLECLH